MPTPIRVLIVEPNGRFAQSLRVALESTKEIIVIDAARDYRAAMELLLLFRVDVVVWDMELDRLNESRALAHLCRLNPNSRVLALCCPDQEYRMLEALQRGAWGYKIKDEKVLDEIVGAVRTVYRGGAVVGSRIAGKMLDDIQTRHTFEGMWSERAA